MKIFWPVYLVLLSVFSVSSFFLHDDHAGDNNFRFIPLESDQLEESLDFIMGSTGYFIIFKSACTSSAPSGFSIITPSTPPDEQYQVLGNVDISTGRLGWITTVTNSEQLQLLYTATSADIPLTLVLRDAAGNFAASIITAEGLVVTPTTAQGCIIFTDSGSQVIGNICVNQQAMILAPVPPRALQTANDAIVRGVSAVDLQMSKALSTQVAAGDYSVITGGQNNRVSSNYSVIVGGLSQLISSSQAAIAGGGSNTVSGNNSFVGAGSVNAVTGSYSTIMGGTSNSIRNTFSAIGGGISNTALVNGSGHFIGAGAFNQTNNASSAVLTGSGNTIANNFGSVMSGQSNNASTQAFVGAGVFNRATSGNASIFAGSGNNSPVASPIMGGLSNMVGNNSVFIGAGQFNSITLGNVSNSIVTGSGNIGSSTQTMSMVMGGQSNSFARADVFMGAGLNNTVNAVSGTLVAGSNNSLTGATAISFSGMGQNCTGANSLLAGGLYNTISGTVSGILSGSGNTIANSGNIIMSGQGNSIIVSQADGFIGGGFFNSISGNNTTRIYTGILTGSGNSTNNATTGTILGGKNHNVTGASTCVGGSGISATANGAFSWADASTTTLLVSGTVNGFLARCANGANFYSSSNLSTGVTLPAGGNSWSSLSDVNVKENFIPVDTQVMLSKVITMSVQEWNFIEQGPSMRHIGPTAQDFNTRFGFTENPLYINTSDALGVLFASVQGLYQLYQE